MTSLRLESSAIWTLDSDDEVLYEIVAGLRKRCCRLSSVGE